MSFELETARLRMRPWAETDAAGYLELVAEREPRAQHGERGDHAPTEHNIRQRIASQLAERHRTGLALLPIRRRVEGDFIGYCGLIVGRGRPGEPEIAYELLRAAWGSGYATEAARAVMGSAAETGRRRLWATVRSWNAPSFRVLDRLGFERDHVSAEDERGDLVWMTRLLD